MLNRLIQIFLTQTHIKLEKLLLILIPLKKLELNKKMVKVISFCLYGKGKKYAQGIIENLEIIQRELLDFQTWIYIGNDVDPDYIEKYKEYNVKLIFINNNNVVSYRFFPIDIPSVELLFSRDADSRINKRDLWTMFDFMNSEKKFHIIRDNVWHKSKRICGGLFGIKQGLLSFKIEEMYQNYQNINHYGADEEFLEIYIYPAIKHSVLIHSDLIAYQDEEYPHKIEIENTGDNFIGNVYEYNDNTPYPKFNYWDQLYQYLIEHIKWLVAQNAWLIIINIFEKSDLDKLDSTKKHGFLDYVYMAYYYLDRIDEARKVLSLFKYSYVDEHIIFNTNYLFNKLRGNGYRIIGTTYIDRTPKENEIIIIYGNYHHSVDNLPTTDLIKRHAIYYRDVQHDDFEFDPCWNEIGTIFILNLIERVDRYMEIVFELCRMNAPLNRIHHYKAKKESITGNKAIDPHLGACQNHIDAVKMFIDSKQDNCLILEDDVTFTSDIDTHKKSLSTFFERKYEFDVCLILSSKYWEIKEYDDLLSRSYQTCTTTAGYIVSKDGANKVLSVFSEGYQKMKETGNTLTFAVDRYWAKLQANNKFFLFNNKFGYQRCNYSSITGQTTCHFD